MALQKGDVKNFETLRKAFQNGDAALIESRDKDGHYVALIVAMGFEGDTYYPVPFAEMVRGNPFELYADPTAEELPIAIEEQS